MVGEPEGVLPGLTRCASSNQQVVDHNVICYFADEHFGLIPELHVDPVGASVQAVGGERTHRVGESDDLVRPQVSGGSLECDILR